jgi:hypothetical protein
MKKTATLSVVLALLIASPALARTHHHRQSKATPYGYVGSTYSAPAYPTPTYPNEVPWAPF